MKKMMNKISYALIVFVLLASTSCEKSLIGIKGEGAIVEQELPLDAITGFDLDISGNVHIEQGDTQLIVVKAQQNIINNLKTKINNETLIIDYDKNVRSHDGMDIYITLPIIKRTRINGTGNINTVNHFSQEENIDLGISGSGNINVTIDANEIYCDLSGSGNININSTCNYLSTQTSGSGNYNLKGSATEAEHAIDGSGKIIAFDFLTENTTINNSGSSKAEVSVSETLDVNISGSGDIYYKGTPAINISISGSGQLIQAN